MDMVGGYGWNVVFTRWFHTLSVLQAEEEAAEEKRKAEELKKAAEAEAAAAAAAAAVESSKAPLPAADDDDVSSHCHFHPFVLYRRDKVIFQNSEPPSLIRQRPIVFIRMTFLGMNSLLVIFL